MATLARADDLVTTAGKRYANVHITEVTPATIAFKHASGVARIPLAEFGRDVQQKFGYDATKARAWIVAQTAPASPTPRPKQSEAWRQVNAIAHRLDDGEQITIDPRTGILYDRDVDAAQRAAVIREIQRHGSPRPVVQPSSPVTR